MGRENTNDGHFVVQRADLIVARARFPCGPRTSRISTRALRWAASIEIKSGVSWTLAKKLDTFAGPGEIKGAGPSS